MSPAGMGDSRPSPGLPGSPQDPQHEKSNGKKLVTIPDQIRPFWEVEALKTPSKTLGKSYEFLGSGTGREIDWKNVSGALRPRPATEKRKEEARAGHGARFLQSGT